MAPSHGKKEIDKREWPGNAVLARPTSTWKL